MDAGVLLDLHEPIVAVDRKEATCGSLNVHSYQKLKAIEWAVETINNKSWPGEFSLGEEEISEFERCWAHIIQNALIVLNL